MFSKSLHWQSGELSDPFGFCLQIHFSSRGLSYDISHILNSRDVIQCICDSVFLFQFPPSQQPRKQRDEQNKRVDEQDQLPWLEPQIQEATWKAGWCWCSGRIICIYLGLYICHKFSDLLPDLIVCFSLEVEIVSITALNLARMELELDLHLQQVGLNQFIAVACYTSGSNLENGFILK